MAVYPSFQAFWIGFGTIGATVLYQEAHSFSTKQWLLYVAAVFFMLAGLYFLWKHADARSKETTKKRWASLRFKCAGRLVPRKASAGVARQRPVVVGIEFAPQCGAYRELERWYAQHPKRRR